MSADDGADAALDAALDALYGARPEDFTALRKELSAAARKRGDRDAAKVLAAARRPTAAAWVVNALVRADPAAKRRLGEVTAELRAAHAAMDGVRIRESSTAQRRLVSDLVKAAFATAGVDAPTAALRDDVTDTLNAAIAAPEVAERLGRLEKAERWSGFGDFGVAAQVGTTRRKAPEPTVVADEPDPAAQQRRAEAQAVLAAATAERDRALGVAADRRAAVVAARRRYEQLLESLHAAERDVDAADAELDAADAVARDAAQRAERAEAELAALTD